MHAYSALIEAPREFPDEGRLAARDQRYAGQSSVVLRSYKLPPTITYEALHDALKAGGFVIYAGQGDLSKTLFRV